MAGTPVAQALARGAKSLMVFDTGASSVDADQVADLGWYSVMAIAFSHLVRGQTAHDLAHVARQIPVVVLSSTAGSPIDFKQAVTMFDAAQQVAARELALVVRVTNGSIKAPGIYGSPSGLSADERLAPLFLNASQG